MSTTATTMSHTTTESDLATGVTATIVILFSAILAFGARQIYGIWTLLNALAAIPRL